MDPTGQEIDNNWNFHDYQVNGEKFSITLAKYHLSFNDTGDYTLIADNSVLKKILTFHLEVTGKYFNFLSILFCYAFLLS